MAEAALKLDPANREANRIIGSVYAALAEQRQASARGRARSSTCRGRLPRSNAPARTAAATSASS